MGTRIEAIDETLHAAIAALTTESLSPSLMDDGPWWQPAGRKLRGIPYHQWTWSDLDICRQESRRLFTHNEYAIGATRVRVGYVVDQGFHYSVVPNEGEPLSPDDVKPLNDYLQLITEANNFGAIESETLARIDRDGEASWRLFWHADGIVDIRTVEPERMRPGPDADSNWYSPERWGIAVETYDAKRIRGYWVEPSPGDPPELVDESEIVHIAANTDGSIPRGIPIFQPVFENLRRCEDLLTAMTTIAKARAKIAVIRRIQGLNEVRAETIRNRLTTGVQQNPDGTARQTLIDDYPFGSVIRTTDKETFEFPSSNVGSADLIAVLQADLRAVASLLSMPEWMFTGLADQKYSNAFVVEAPTLKAFRRLQGLLIRRLATGRYASQASLLWRCLRMAADHGVISRETLAKCKVKCVPPSLEVRDKQAEASVNRTYLDAGVTDKQTVQESIGLDPVETNRRIAEQKPVTPDPKQEKSPDPFGRLTQVNESWYTRRALAWVTEGGDRSHLVKTKTTDKNGVQRTVYKLPAGYHKTGSEHTPTRTAAKADISTRVRTKLANPAALKAADIQSLGDDLKAMTKPEIHALRKEIGQVGGGKKPKQELIDGITAFADSRRTIPSGLKDLTPAESKNYDRSQKAKGDLRAILTRSGLEPGKAASIQALSRSMGGDHTANLLAVSHLVDAGELSYAPGDPTSVVAGDKWTPTPGVEVVHPKPNVADKQAARQAKWQARADALNRVIPSWVGKIADALDAALSKPFVKESLGDDADPFEIADAYIAALLDAAETDPAALDSLLSMLTDDGSPGTVELTGGGGNKTA